MAQVYVISDGGCTTRMERIVCKDETRELQDILHHNPDLLPGDQIDPDVPRRWMLIKREMPVPDPNNGTARWSIDFFFVDQDAMPTFVECKRFSDTRSRREVVGQVLEYAANGHYYWTKDLIRDYAEKSAREAGMDLSTALARLKSDAEEVDGFFERVQENLREGQVRLIFFMEHSPLELRSLVDFLNKQMERSEVLLVEAQQFQLGGIRIVVPTLFGYTEQARQVKRLVTVTKGLDRSTWDEKSFFARAQELSLAGQLSPSALAAMTQVIEFCQAEGAEISGGTGKETGSLKVKYARICPRNLFAIFTNGGLYVPFGDLRGDPRSDTAREAMKSIINSLGLIVPEDYTERWPTYDVSLWTPKVGQFLGSLKQLRGSDSASA